MKYYFKIDLKDEILQGRTVAHIGKQLDINYAYLTRVLSGSIHCSLKTAKMIANAIDDKAEVTDFFRTEDE